MKAVATAPAAAAAAEAGKRHLSKLKEKYTTSHLSVKRRGIPTPHLATLTTS